LYRATTDVVQLKSFPAGKTLLSVNIQALFDISDVWILTEKYPLGSHYL
jgi:hypothetical protein